MGLFDAVRSLFGTKADSDASDDDGTDPEAAREADPGPAQAPDSDDEESARANAPTAEEGDEPSARTEESDRADDDDAGTEPLRTDEPNRADDAGGPGAEIVGDADAADDISEWTFDEGASEDDDAEAESDDSTGYSDDAAGEDDDAAGEADDEPVSWEETGFEQLTTELVDEEDEDEDDPADLITEAEPDRVDEASTEETSAGAGAGTEAGTAEDDEASQEAEDGMAAAMSAADESADKLDDVGTGEGVSAESDDAADSETDLPLGAEAVEEGAAESESVDVPEDSPRADFVSEAVDLAEFWAEYDLDFTVGSLERLDEMVADQWDPERFADAEFGGEGYDSEVFTEQVRAIGSYLGEVIVRTHGGEWVRQDGVGWTVDVQAGPDVDAAGATVTVFHIAQSALRGEASVAARHDGVVEQLDLDERVGVDDPTATLQQAGGHSQPRSADEDVVERFRAGAEDLADRWPDYDLDFSTASLDRLEALLAEELEDGRFDDVELGDETDRDSLLLTAHAVGVGGYLAEVLRREHDADWVTDDRLIVVVETDEQRHEVDPIEAAVAAIRGERSLTDAVPGGKP